MHTILRRLRGALGLAVVWGLVGFGLGGLLELVDPDGRYADVWPMVVAIPCFVGGLVFSLVLGVAGRGRRFDELSFARFTAWGAGAGLLLGALPMLVSRLATPRPLTLVNLVVLAVTTTTCAALAAATLAVARRAQAGSAEGAGSLGDATRSALPPAEPTEPMPSSARADRMPVR